MDKSTTSPGDQQAEDGATVDKVDEAEAEAEDEDEGVIPTTPEEDKKLDEQAKKGMCPAPGPLRSFLSMRLGARAGI